MRTTPILGTKPWFGPRGGRGWGWAPISWEGWVTSAISVAALLVGASVRPGWPTSIGGAALVCLVCWLKGTSPGGERTRREFEHRRRTYVHGGGDPAPHLADIVEHWDERRKPTRMSGRPRQHDGRRPPRSPRSPR